jgi:3-oxoacyl-[acyl-carrier protein] reductase
MKAALLHVTKNWARDGANAGVRVNAIMPGWVKGEGVEARLAEEAARTGAAVVDLEAGLVGRHAGVFWNRRMGLPQDYADAIAFLVSERAAYINGALVPVDGGSGA